MAKDHGFGLRVKVYYGYNRKTLTNILKCQKKTNNYEYEFKYI